MIVVNVSWCGKYALVKLFCWNHNHAFSFCGLGWFLGDGSSGEHHGRNLTHFLSTRGIVILERDIGSYPVVWVMAFFLVHWRALSLMTNKLKDGCKNGASWRHLEELINCVYKRMERMSVWRECPWCFRVHEAWKKPLSGILTITDRIFAYHVFTLPLSIFRQWWDQPSTTTDSHLIYISFGCVSKPLYPLLTPK